MSKHVSQVNAISFAAEQMGNEALDHLARIIEGRFDVRVPDTVSRKQSLVIASHVAEVIEREISWVEKGVQPWPIKNWKGVE